MALLLEGGTIRYPLHSEDTDATLECLSDFSADIRQDPDTQTVQIQPTGPLRIESDDVFVGESGTLLRFLIPICTVLDGPDTVTLAGEGTLRDRSNREPVESLREAGFRVEGTGEDATVPITCYPGQTPESYPVPVACSTTSQYLSGWLLALGALRGGSLRRTTDLVSGPYVSMTEDVLTEAGVEITHPTEADYKLDADSTTPLDYTVPGDYSSAAFFLVGAFLGGQQLTLDGLNPADRQADRRIVGILKDLGAEVTWSDSSLSIRGADSIASFGIDAGDCPDLAPILAVLGCFSQGEATITNVEHLVNKESDRINRTAEELRKTGVEVITGSGEIAVRGSVDGTEATELNAHGDHRLAMAFSILGMNTGSVTVTGVECVSKSYPGFFEDLESLGADFELIEE